MYPKPGDYGGRGAPNARPLCLAQTIFEHKGGASPSSSASAPTVEQTTPSVTHTHASHSGSRVCMVPHSSQRTAPTLRSLR